MRRSSRLVGVGALLVVLVSAGVGTAGQPIEEVRDSVERVLAIITDPELKAPDKADERAARLRTITEEHFALREMAQRALGRHWKVGRSDEEREAFVALFTELIELTYMSEIELYTGETYLFPGEKIDGDLGVVETRLVTKRNREIPIDYRVVRAATIKTGRRTTSRPTTRPAPEWLVYDVVVEHVSLVNNYRTQIRDIMARSSYKKLLEKLREKVEKLKADAAAAAKEREKEAAEENPKS